MSVDLSAQLFAAYEQALARARLRRDEGRIEDAAAAFRQSAAYLVKYSENVRNDKARTSWEKRADSLRSLAENLEGGRVAVPTIVGSATPDSDLEDAVTGLIHTANVSWNDIAGLEETKRDIKTSYGLALVRRPDGVKVETFRNVLFYGPPGTGKTLLAAATSRGLEATFFNVKVSNLLSKYFGESTRLVSALYTAGRRLSPSVIFLDEFEALSPPRDGSQSGAEARLISTFLAELDGLAEKGDERFLLTIAATNVPWLIDPAILSRFERLVYIPLPDEPARRRIFELNVDERGHRSIVGLDELARRSEGYSGREVAQLAKEAIAKMVDRSNPNLVDAVDTGREAVEGYALQIEHLTADDWTHAFRRVVRRSGASDIARYQSWRNQRR
jgi:SpoVK/Ycf46/Vps4 family AAA+-type ATPase